MKKMSLMRLTILWIEDFERVSLGFGVGVVNSGKIDEGEETEDFDKDLKDKESITRIQSTI